MTTCATCRHWSRYERAEPCEWNPHGLLKDPITLPAYRREEGSCDRLPTVSSEVFDVDHVGCYDHHATGYLITTHETFGCTLHEAREGD